MSRSHDSLHLEALHLLKEDQPKAALKLMKSLQPLGNDPALYNTLAVCYEETGDLKGAEATYRKGIAAEPRISTLHTNLGNVLHKMQKWNDAIQAYKQALRLNPEDASAIKNLGTTYLTLGDYAQGWPLWLRSRAAKLPAMPGKYWYGEPLHGKRILAFERQGFGDTLQFIRYLPLLQQQGGELILEVQPALVPLIARHHPGVTIVPRPDGAALSADFHIPLMSLPQVLGVADPVAVPAPYLTDVDGTDLPATDKPLKVGVTWASTSGIQPWKNCPFSEFATIFNAHNTAFYALMLAAGPETSHPKLLPLADRLTDFLATARHIQSLDAVVTVDTAIAHLAGAMGKTTLLMLPYAADWRWHTDSVSRWYPSVEIFRQGRPDLWAGPVRAVAQRLRTMERRTIG